MKKILNHFKSKQFEYKCLTLLLTVACCYFYGWYCVAASVGGW